MDNSTQAGNVLIAGNKLIAKFMGVPFDDCDYTDDISMGGNAEAVRYHRDWSWLMPVVEKIEAIENSDRYEVDIFGNCCEIGVLDEHSAVGKTKIEATWLAVIEFITWLNTQPKTNTHVKE